MRRQAAATASLAFIAALSILLGSSRATGQISAADAAAVVVFPYVVVDSANGTDTIIQLSNASGGPVSARCLFEDVTSLCSNQPARTCRTDSDCPPGGICTGSWTPTDFQIQLTARQPVGWRAGQGSMQLGIQPRRDPFLGLLRCVVVDASSALPRNLNALEGSALVDHFVGGAPPEFDTARYNAIGVRSLLDDGSGQQDQTLNLDGNEYVGCPTNTLLGHFFENATDPVSNQGRLQTDLVLVPCSVDYLAQQPASVMVHYNVYNEFAQRIGTSKRFTAQQVSTLSGIHPTVFDAATQGTLTGQTVVAPIATGPGVLAIAVTRGGAGSAALNLAHRGQRFQPDMIVLP
jgi:hypothetical protein